jgi:ketopantoate reductase
MEVEAILGNTIRAARRENVSTPKLDGVYALMKMIQASFE